MNKKKILFSILTIIILLISSIGVYSCYQITKDGNETVDFNQNYVLYDILDTVYPISFELDNVGKEGINKYITANKTTTNSFYQSNIIYNLERMDSKKNIIYYATGNNNISSNTNDNLANIQNDKNLQDKYQWYVMLNFDENGILSYDSLGNDKSVKQNFELIWNNYKQSNFDYLYYDGSDWTLNNPSNFTIYLAVPQNIITDSEDSIAYEASNLVIENIIPIALCAIVVVCIYILIYPYETEKEIGIFKYPAKIKLEPLAILIAVAFAGIIVVIYSLIVDFSNGYYLSRLNSIGLTDYSEAIIATMNVVAWMGLLYLAMFTIFYLKSYFKEGFVNSLKKNTICAWILKTIKHLIDKAANFDFNDDINKTILKIVVVNCIIVSIICCFFTFGIFFTLIYSAILFYILKNKFKDFQKNYQVLLTAVKRLSNGDFDVEVHQDIGIFNSLGHEFTNVKNGFEKAVNEEVKSQKMKTELISNVSHDLKTPLTSIITYIDLLKNEDLDKQQQREYINTLDRNALRLKNLIDDLFEVAKVNSGDVKLNIVPVDIIALIQQAKFELEDQFNAKNLIFKTNYPDEKIILNLDSSKTYRIFQNLLTNISKYALENTRVYIDIIKEDNQVNISFKNISADEIKVSEAKLVERFVQGDTSRNTSGSGLGLSIAKSFTELQHGTFNINVDGDLFKTTVIFNLK